MKTECKHSLDVSPSGHMASCKLCGFVGRWRDGVWEKVEEPASATQALDMLQMLRDIDTHFSASFGEQAWATSEIGGMTRVTIAKAAGMAYACARCGKAWREGDIYPPPDRREE